MDLSNCKRVLLFGGSFDPPHVAHLVLPMLAMEAIDADVLAYVPAALSPHKPDQPPTPRHHRLAMLRLMIADLPVATVLTDELDRFDASRGQPSYTVDTLVQLRARLGPGPQLRLLIGADQLRSFDSWREPQRIIELAEPLVMLRPPDTRQSLLASLPKGFDALVWEKRLVDLPVMDVRATRIRQRAAAGKPIAGFVHPLVEQYIRKHGLYRP